MSIRMAGAQDDGTPPEGAWLGNREIFRAEAVAHKETFSNMGSVLRIFPRWAQRVYWMSVAVLVCGLAFVALGSVDEYARGIAIVRVDGKHYLTAVASGTVQAVAVEAGQRVQPGDQLVELSAPDEAAELERIEHQLEQELVKTLRDPNDVAGRQLLIGLRTQQELAERRLRDRLVRSPVAGVVSDVRIREGQHLATGEPILSIIGDDARFSVIAMLPAHYRPMMSAGMPIRLELNGYRYAYVKLAIDQIGDEVVGPAETRRYVGPELADAVSLQGPVVLVQAHLPRRTFLSEGRTFNYFDGMQGFAEARVRSESILSILLPGLKGVRGE